MDIGKKVVFTNHSLLPQMFSETNFTHWYNKVTLKSPGPNDETETACKLICVTETLANINNDYDMLSRLANVIVVLYPKMHVD